MLQDILPDEDIQLPQFQVCRRPADFDFEKHVAKVKKEREERKTKSKPRWARKPKVDINQLVDEISQMYIEKRGGVIPEGVQYTSPPEGQKKSVGAIGTGRGRGKGKQPVIKPARFNPELSQVGKYVGTEDYQYDGETFAHLGGYRENFGGVGLDLPSGEYVAQTGGYRQTKKGGYYNDYSSYDDYMNQGQAYDLGMGNTGRRGMGRGMLGVDLSVPQYNMWGYVDHNASRGRGGLLNYKKTRQHFK